VHFSYLSGNTTHHVTAHSKKNLRHSTGKSHAKLLPVLGSLIKNSESKKIDKRQCHTD